MEDIDLFNGIFNDVASAEASTPHFLQKVGCRRACDFFEYNLELVRKGPNILNSDLRMVEFSMSQDLVPTHEDHFNYTGSSFVADLGGFLGLLLGLCCENIFDFVTEKIAWAARKLGKKRPNK